MPVITYIHTISKLLGIIPMSAFCFSFQKIATQDFWDHPFYVKLLSHIILKFSSKGAKLFHHRKFTLEFKFHLFHCLLGYGYGRLFCNRFSLTSIIIIVLGSDQSLNPFQVDTLTCV